jgi:hypothetical protein
MTTRDEIREAIQAVDARLEAMRERILAHGETPQAEGTWRIRDALCHLAARANGVDRVVQRAIAAATPGAPQPTPPRSIDEINAGQVEERTDLSVEALLDEIRNGHRAALAALERVEDEMLERLLSNGFRPGESPVADLIVRGGPGHDHGHVDQIEAVLPPA